jgi:hypothetical protein
MSLQFGFVNLWQNAFGAKAALKMLVKLTPGGSMGPGYDLKLFCCVESQQWLLKLEEKKRSFGIPNISERDN